MFGQTAVLVFRRGPAFPVILHSLRIQPGAFQFRRFCQPVPGLAAQTAQARFGLFITDVVQRQRLFQFRNRVRVHKPQILPRPRHGDVNQVKIIAVAGGAVLALGENAPQRVPVSAYDMIAEDEVILHALDFGGGEDIAVSRFVQHGAYFRPGCLIRNQNSCVRIAGHPPKQTRQRVHIPEAQTVGHTAAGVDGGFRLLHAAVPPPRRPPQGGNDVDLVQNALAAAVIRR